MNGAEKDPAVLMKSERTLLRRRTYSRCLKFCSFIGILMEYHGMTKGNPSMKPSFVWIGPGHKFEALESMMGKERFVHKLRLDETTVDDYKAAVNDHETTTQRQYIHYKSP